MIVIVSVCASKVTRITHAPICGWPAPARSSSRTRVGCRPLLYLPGRVLCSHPDQGETCQRHGLGQEAAAPAFFPRCTSRNRCRILDLGAWEPQGWKAVRPRHPHPDGVVPVVVVVPSGATDVPLIIVKRTAPHDVSAVPTSAPPWATACPLSITQRNGNGTFSQNQTKMRILQKNSAAYRRQLTGGALPGTHWVPTPPRQRISVFRVMNQKSEDREFRGQRVNCRKTTPPAPRRSRTSRRCSSERRNGRPPDNRQTNRPARRDCRHLPGCYRP